MTHLFEVIATVLNFAVLLVGLWAIATLTVELAILERKSRPGRQSTKRQGKFYNIIVTDGEEGRK